MRNHSEPDPKEMFAPWFDGYVEFKVEKSVPPPTVEFIGDWSKDSISDASVVAFFAGAFFGGLLVAAAVVL